MLVFPNAKINIGLNVIERRSDGYHNIESCFYPVPWQDALEVIESKKLAFTATGIPVPGESNICLDAYHLLAKEYALPPVNIHLHKNIPIGAGLGGGSADGAFMLKLLNEKFHLDMSNARLKDFALELGSDCPFFIENEPCYVEGTGNFLSPINLKLVGLYILIVYPDTHIETKSAYQGIHPSKPEISLKQSLANNPIENWPGLVHNDFENNISPKIIALKESLYSSQAVYASMTGSGSAVYGFFKEKPVKHPDYLSIVARL